MLGIIFGLTGLPMPEIIDSVLSSASACVGPLSMLLTGITLSTFALGELVKDKTAYIFSALRLVVIPAIAFLICRGLRLVELAPMVLIITCMPCGLNTVIFPKFVGEDTSTGARLAFLSHFISCATIPFWLYLII